MKIAVTSTGPTIDHYVGKHFHCSAYLLIVDTHTMQYETMINPAIALRGPAAGKLFRRIIVQANVSTIVTGKCGTNIFKILGPAGVRIVAGVSGSVRNVLKRLKPTEFSRPA